MGEQWHLNVTFSPDGATATDGTRTISLPVTPEHQVAALGASEVTIPGTPAPMASESVLSDAVESALGLSSTPPESVTVSVVGVQSDLDRTGLDAAFASAGVYPGIIDIQGTTPAFSAAPSPNSTQTSSATSGHSYVPAPKELHGSDAPVPSATPSYSIAGDTASPHTAFGAGPGTVVQDTAAAKGLKFLADGPPFRLRWWQPAIIVVLIITILILVVWLIQGRGFSSADSGASSPTIEAPSVDLPDLNMDTEPDSQIGATSDAIPPDWAPTMVPSVILDELGRYCYGGESSVSGISGAGGYHQLVPSIDCSYIASDFDNLVNVKFTDSQYAADAVENGDALTEDVTIDGSPVDGQHIRATKLASYTHISLYKDTKVVTYMLDTADDAETNAFARDAGLVQ